MRRERKMYVISRHYPSFKYAHKTFIRCIMRMGMGLIVSSETVEVGGVF